MIHYILQVILFQLLFLVVYDLFLKKETFFNYNRLYLLGTSVVSFVIPFLKIETIQQRIPQEFKVQLPTVLLGNGAETNANSAVLLDEIVITQQSISWSTLAIGIYLLGMVISMIVFTLKLRKLYLLKKTASLEKTRTNTIATVPKSGVAFTFLRTIFLGDELTEPHKSNILQHELVHVQQRHTLDLLFFEALRILFWCNPMVYVFQRKIQSLHEYEADRRVASKDKAGYYQNLLSEVFGTTKISFINTFYKSSIIKNRIVMLQKSNSKKIFQLKYLLLIPAVCAMLFYTSCSEEKISESSDLKSKITNLSTEISSKGELSREEESALVELIYNHYPDGVGGISGEKGEIHLDKDRKHFKTAGVPFGTLDHAPIFPGCDENNSEGDNKKCFTEKVATFVVSNFPKKELNESGVSGKNRIVVEFIIDEYGFIGDLNIRANHPFLQMAARNVFEKFPAVEPGMHEGKKVSVFYTLPIIVDMDE